MKAIPVIGKVEGGKFRPEDPRAFKAAFYPHEKKRVRITVERFRNRRSDEANAYYWGVVVPMIQDAIGEEDPETVHEMLKAEFNYEILAIGNKEIRKVKSTAKLDTKEFSEYVERVRKFASEFLSLYIPDPGET